MNIDRKITIAVSGKKFSGKTSLCSYLKAYYGCKYYCDLSFKQEADGSIVWHDKNENQTVTKKRNDQITQFVDRLVKIYNFADNLKEICINNLGLLKEQVYGTEEQKNSLTQFQWENFPDYIRHNGVMLRCGYMTAREVLQVFGTDIMRKMFYDRVWVNSTISKIERDAPLIALIADLRFRSEFIPMCESGAYVIRLERKVYEDSHVSEIDLDGFNFDQYLRCLVIPAGAGLDDKNKMAVKWLDRILNDEF